MDHTAIIHNANSQWRTIAMSINPFLTKQVKRYILSLIVDYNYKNFSDLSHSDKCELASYLIDSYSKQDEHEFLIQSPLLTHIIFSFKKSLKGHITDDENFLAFMKESTVDYFEPTMETLFNEIYHDHTMDILTETLHLKRYGDADNLREYQQEGL